MSEWQGVMPYDYFLAVRMQQRDPNCCVHGHPRIPENLYVHQGGYLDCRVCQRERTARSRARRRAVA